MPRKKVATETPEEKRIHNLQRLLEDYSFIPEPTYIFQIGDRVDIGNLQDAFVVEVLEGGKIYEIDYTYVDNNYGNPIHHFHNRRFVTWFEIRPQNTHKESDLVHNQDLFVSFMHMTMREIFGKVYRFGTDLNPEYQRGYVWSTEDNVALIDSIFSNIDIGKFVFVKLDFGFKYLYEILDGKQRIRAILDYYENRFPYKGYYFNDLSVRDQDHFEDYGISVAVVDAKTREQKLRYFLHLNKHGKIMDKDHLKMVEDLLNNEEKK